MTSKKKLHIHNENKVKVVIHNTNPKSKRRRRTKNTNSTRTLGNPVQGQIQPIIINHSAPPRDESQNELNRLAHNYIQPDLRNNLLLRNEPEPQVEFENIVQPEKKPLMIKPKREYTVKPLSIKAQLGFPDNSDVNYLNKTYKTLKSLKEHIKKENPTIPDSVLKTINSKNRNEKLSEYIKWKDTPKYNDVSGGGVSQSSSKVIKDLQGNVIYPLPTLVKQNNDVEPQPYSKKIRIKKLNTKNK